MPSSYLQGIQNAFDNQAQIVNDIYVVTTNWFVNRCPIVARTPRVPVGSTTFTIVSRGFRPRVALAAASIAAGDAQVTLVDASPFMNGDVLELASGERVEIIGDPNLVNNTVPVRRGAEGTTPGAGSANDIIRLISNSRTGSRDQPERRGDAPVGRPPVLPDLAASGPGGRVAPGLGRLPGPAGIRTPFEQVKMDALQNLMDDMEVSSYYGRGEDPPWPPGPSRRA